MFERRRQSSKNTVIVIFPSLSPWPKCYGRIPRLVAFDLSTITWFVNIHLRSFFAMNTWFALTRAIMDRGLCTGNSADWPRACSTKRNPTQIAWFMGPIWGPPGSCQPQMGPMLAPWTLLSGKLRAMLTDKNLLTYWLTIFWTLGTKLQCNLNLDVHQSIRKRPSICCQ